MSDPRTLILACVAGGALGALFFGGLWWTVRRAVEAKQPAPWIFGSLLVRTIATLAGFYLVAAGRPDRLLVCLLGFVLARLVVTRMTRPSEETEPSPSHEARHAP